MNPRHHAEEATPFRGLQCPVPIRDYPKILLGHGGGGKLSAELIEHVFLPAFGTDFNPKLADSTPLDLPGSRIAITTDSFVVQPLFFPGGSIGSLAVNGTVNDLAMSGAIPRYLTAAFILEEGFEVERLIRIAQDMAMAAETAGVYVVAGDTKVVERGRGDGCYINTSGIGTLESHLRIAPDRAEPGDVVLISGTLGDHGMAIMSLREGLEFESPIRSDCAALHDLVRRMIETGADIKSLRDPTRGGVATCLNEIARASGCGIVIEESSLPIDPVVQSACEFLGLDPMMVANEGKLIAVVPSSDAEDILAAMRQHELGRRAMIIGQVIDDPHRLVVARTAVGTHRIITTPLGEQLPRIC